LEPTFFLAIAAMVRIIKSYQSKRKTTDERRENVEEVTLEDLLMRMTQGLQVDSHKKKTFNCCELLEGNPEVVPRFTLGKSLLLLTYEPLR
jgi:hypothetical protein